MRYIVSACIQDSDGEVSNYQSAPQWTRHDAIKLVEQWVERNSAMLRGTTIKQDLPRALKQLDSGELASLVWEGNSRKVTLGIVLKPIGYNNELR